MLTVYAIPVSLYCAKLRIVLRHKGLEWQEIPPPGGYGSAEYRALVPAGNLPALRHDGFLIADGEATAEYLDEVFPSRTLLPGSAKDRAHARMRSRFHDTRLEPAVRALFRHIGEDPGRDVLDPISQQINARLTELAQLLEIAPPAADLTLGDCGFPITAEWIEALTPVFDLRIEWPAAVQTYLEQVRQFPAVAAELASYRPVLMDWLRRETGA